MEKDIIGWWSGGATSAVACKLAIRDYGTERCRIVMIDTLNEHVDTYRFREDCEAWYGVPIEVIKSERFKSIQDVWRKYKALNHATGAVCSYFLKNQVRVRWERDNMFTHQIFGFEYTKKEIRRYEALKTNHPHTKPLAPLIYEKINKIRALDIIQKQGIQLPMAYKLGYSNNNCLETGCVQGGVGYWKKIQKEEPDKFNRMAIMEHELTESKGSPVTMLRDQSMAAKESGNSQVFLRKNKKYPNLKCLDDMRGREVRPLVDCNGFCGTNDLNPVHPTDFDINREQILTLK